eukprot:XP_014048144.1 PREDICTED: nuclear body protein SP140-like protein isoform X3 [Salmo salar]
MRNCQRRWRRKRRIKSRRLQQKQKRRRRKRRKRRRKQEGKIVNRKSEVRVLRRSSPARPPSPTPVRRGKSRGRPTVYVSGRGRKMTSGPGPSTRPSSQSPVGSKKARSSGTCWPKGRGALWSRVTGSPQVALRSLGGKKSSRKWKYSIRCSGTTLGELIQEGHLTSPDFKRRKSAQRALFPSNQSRGSITQSEEDDDDDEEDEVEEEAEQEREEGEREEQANTAEGGSDKGGSHGAVKKSVFKVTYGDINGTLHKHRFASGSCGKSIRTELRWMTPVEFVTVGSALEDPSWKKDIQWDGKSLSLLIESKILVIHSLLCKCNLCSSTANDRHDQDNDDDCFICRSQGSLICCDECPRSFHQRCHLPNVDDAIMGDDCPWMCTFCVQRTSQSWRYPKQMTYQEALTCRISDHLLECQYLLLCLYHVDEDHIFVKDPCINVRNYTSVIKTPICLDRVVEKLQQNLYQTVQHFVSDVLLIFTNCATFNRDNAEFHGMGERLKDLFEREFKSTFSIQLQHPTASNSQ